MANLRSLLFAPGNQERKSRKALNYPGADGVCLDLEDAVPAANKGEAREAVGDLLRSGPPRPFYVRINGLRTPHCYADLRAVVSPGLLGIVLPRYETMFDLAIADWLLSALEAERRLEPFAIEVIPTIESAMGLENLRDIRDLSPRFRRLSFGAWDFTLDTGIKYTRDEAMLSHARASIVIHSRVASLASPIDTSFPFIGDLEGLKASSVLARDMGYGGKACIHPEQVDIVNAAFSPSEDELAEAREIVDGFLASEALGEAAVQVRGKFIDYPVYEQAKRLLQRFEAE